MGSLAARSLRGVLVMRQLLLAAFAAMLFGSMTMAQEYPPVSRPQPGKTGFDIPITGRNPSIPTIIPREEIADPKLKYNYELKPEHGEFLVFVKSFQGKFASDQSGLARELAEGLVEYIRTECKLYAYIYESGWPQRQQRKKEKDAMEVEARKYYASQGHSPAEIDKELRKMLKMARIPDEYSVFVAPGKGSLKNMDEALDFAKYVRRLKAPPAEFCDSLVVGSAQDLARQKGEPKNPFPMAMPGRNTTLPKKEVTMERPKADDFLMSLNAGKPNSLIHNTKKKYTLVVKTYGTSAGQLQKPGEVTTVAGRSDGALLERSAQHAHLMAEMLRSMKKKPGPFEAYVLHTRFESFLCVGEYDSQEDPQLKANLEALRSFRVTDKESGQVLETFMEKPLPAMIPRP